MNLNQLSKNEKKLLFITVLLAIFVLYWQFLLNPVLSAKGKAQQQVNSLNNQIAAMKTQISTLGSAAVPQAVATGPNAFFGSQTEKLKQVTDFMDKKFRWFGVDLSYMQHSLTDKGLTLNFKFTSSYFQFLGVFNALAKLNVYSNVETVNVVLQDDKLVTDMTISFPYTK
ncbi:MAG: type II secretion system protein GspM [Candidatus Saganbacteria bacterium]|nr:type II secretion system protein GspM [Candidatus Saganbacteria bacterium]